MGRDTDLADLEAAVNAFEARYRRYLGEMAEVYERTSRIRGGSMLLSQRRPFAEDPIHAQALADLRRLADDVTAALGDQPAGGEALAHVTRLVLGEKSTDKIEYWPLVSLEGLAKPWLGGLNNIDLKAISDAYRRANPRWGCLPNQRGIRKEFERLLKDRG